jgi:hypothetical protein
MSQAQTPYSPPLAPVSDPPEPEVPKPPAIWRATRCLLISATIVVLAAAFAVAGVSGSRAGVLLLIAVNLASVGFLALIVWKLNAGRNWARWLFLVLYVLGTVMFAGGLALTPQAFLSLPRLDQAAALVQFALQGAALAFMFTPAAGHWLRSKR